MHIVIPRARRVPLILSIAVLLGTSALWPPRAGAAGPDITPPVVSLTSPAAGSTLIGPVVVSASASDDVGVVGVQFVLDGANLGGELVAGPSYTMQWDVTTARNGKHTLSAVARDAAGNRATSSPLEVTVWKLSSRQASVFAAKPLAVVRDRLGLIPRDYVWAGGPPSSTVVSTGYFTHDRDLLSFHDLAWFKTYRPDWVMYDCDGAPLQYFGDPLVVFDITNPAVREYQYDVLVRAYRNHGLDGIAIDNIFLQNYFGKCGHYDAQRVWRQQYTGQLDDPQHVRDVVSWLTWMSDRVHADQGLIAINVIDLLHPDLDLLTSKVDLVYFEGGGFINTYCAPVWTDDLWLQKFHIFRKLALERGLVIQDETCDHMSQLTPELISWDVANFFLLRGDRSYFSLTQSYARRPLTDPPYEGPELYVPLGEPLGEPQQQGTVWMRQYQNGLVFVNPSSTQDAMISLGVHPFRDLQGRVFAGDVTIPPASGWVLLPVFTGGVYVAAGDVDGDGKADIVTGAGPGGWPRVRVFSGANPAVELAGFLAYSPFFSGGVYVAAGDVDGDGKADIVTGAGPGGGPHVRVFSGTNPAVELAGFLAYSPLFTGGVYVAAGDVDGDGKADIITGAGPGGGPHVRVFSGANPAIELASFLAYSPLFTGGVYVAAGDVDGDGKADIITGAGPGGGPHVRVFSGANPAVELASFFAYSPLFTGGVYVAAGDVDGDGKADIITGAGPGGGPHVRIFTGTGADTGLGFFAYSPGFTGGVRVAVGDVDGVSPGEIITGPGAGGGPHVRVFSGAGADTGIGFFAY